MHSLNHRLTILLAVLGASCASSTPASSPPATEHKEAKTATITVPADAKKAKQVPTGARCYSLTEGRCTTGPGAYQKLDIDPHSGTLSEPTYVSADDKTYQCCYSLAEVVHPPIMGRPLTVAKKAILATTRTVAWV